VNGSGVTQASGEYSYDPLGRVLLVGECTPTNYAGNGYHLTYAYDLLGDIASLNNDREGVTYSNTYNTATQLSTFKSSLVDANHPATLLTVNQYNPLGQPQQATLGNGIVRNLQYDKRGRVTSLTDGSLYSFTLGYQPDSDVHTANDSLNGNWTYTYNGFNRLSQASQTGQAFNYKYDRFGNRWQQNVTTGSGPNPSYTFDANNHITSSGIVYDAAGNITNDGLGHTYTYDAENRLLTVAGSSSATYLYDALGQRVQATINSSPADFIYDQFGRAVTQATASVWQRSELYAGWHVATYTNNTTYFDHSDWLGTVRARSSVSGASVETCTSLPFGDAQTCTGTDWSPLHFTGQDWDSESSLTHFLFRQLSTTQGRWITPDPAGMSAVSPGDPQTWNRYAYVGNMPLNAVDPMGLQIGGGNDVFGSARTSLGFDEFDLAAMGLLPLGGPGAGNCPAQFTGCSQTTGGYTIGVGVGGSSYIHASVLVPQNCGDIICWAVTDQWVDLQQLVGNNPANNGTPQKPTTAHCVGQALAAKGLSIALDIAGAVPAFGNLFSGTVEGIQALNAGYYGTVALANAGNTLLNPSASGAASTAATIGLTVGSLALNGSKVIPVVGNLVSLGTAVYDTTKAVQAYQQCMAGGG